MKIRRVGKILVWTIVGVVGLAILTPFFLYMPFIQDGIKNFATSKVSETTGWQVEVGMIRLQFPLNLRVDDVNIKDGGDTIIAVRSLMTQVEPVPLLHGRVEVRSAQLDCVKYSMASADSSMLLSARMKLIDIVDVSYDLADNAISVGGVSLNGGDVALDLYNDKVQPSLPDTAAASPMSIKIGNVRIDDIRYTMSMLPTVDSLGVVVGHASLDSATIDTGTQRIIAGTLAIDSLYGAFFTPTVEYITSHQVLSENVVADDTALSSGEPWEIQCAAIRLTSSGGIYAMRGTVPIEGLDMNYIQVKNVNLSVDSFYNCGTEIAVPIKRFTVDERSGLRITNASGTFVMDDAGLTLDDFAISTLLSSINADAYIDNDFFSGEVSGVIRLDLDAKVGLAEVERAMPSLKPLLSMVPQYRPLEASVSVSGNGGRLSVEKCTVALPRYAAITVGGNVVNPMSGDNPDLDFTINGNFENINFIKPTMLEAEQQEAVYLPPLLLNGRVKIQDEDINGGLTLTLPSGQLVLDADWKGLISGYDLKLCADSLPVKAILPLSDFGILSVGSVVRGHGFDIFDSSTEIDARIDVRDFEFGKENYRNIRANVRLGAGSFGLNLSSDNDALNLSLNAQGELAPDVYKVRLNADIGNVDMARLGMPETVMHGKVGISLDGMVDLSRHKYLGKLGIMDLEWTMDDDYYYTDAVDIDFESDTIHTSWKLVNGDMSLSLVSPCGIDSLLTRFVKSSEVVTSQIERMVIDADTLCEILPEFECGLKIGNKNLVNQFLESNGVKFNDMQLSVTKDSTFRMNGDIDLLTASGLTIDTIRMYATEHDRHINYMLHAANRDNRNGTGISTAGLLGIVAGNRATVLMRQTNFKDSVGVRFGIDATLDTTKVLLKLIPEDPIIGYKRWYVNEDNHVSFNYISKHFDASVRLQCDSSVVSLTTTKHDDDAYYGQEDIQLDISKVQISDWLTFSPFAPPLKGELGVELKVKYDGNNLWCDCEMHLDDFYYAKKRVGDFSISSLIDLDSQTGRTNITAALEVDDRQTFVAYGVINDTTTANQFDLQLELDRFPLSVANPFMPPNMLNTYGYLNGAIAVSGAGDNPLLSGYLQCDSTYIAVPVFSTNINLPSTQIPIDSGMIKFNDYSIKMLNDNPLVVNGAIDISNLSDVGVNLLLRGQNVQFVNSSQTKNAELFGRGYANLDATVRGSVSDLDVDATVSILSGTNITYVMPTDVNTLTQQQQSDDLVTFVQFNDSTSYVRMDSLQTSNASNINLTARLNIMQGSHVNVFLSSNGTDRAEIEGSGNLTFVLNQLGDMTMTGRYTVSDGYVRYNPPLISQVLFDIQEGSYIQFNGEIMNPMLNLNAVQTFKANVTQEGQNSRLVDFLISLSVTNTLSDMDVKFDLSTNGDVTVQNELQSMSETQRSNQAMNMLLYGVYTGPSTSASSNLASNQLYSFLQSKLNSWAANNIKGIDLSFGIDQYDQMVDGVTSSTMRYSYQVSKSLFNDRFKIVVGGNYSPDMTGDNEIAQSLFNDVSLEYALTKSGSMYLRLFNKSGYESVLEGEVTQTGVGFVLSRKLPKLRYLFNFGRSRQSVTDGSTDDAANVASPAIKEENDTIETVDQ